MMMQMLSKELAQVVERERIVEVARPHRTMEFAQGGRNRIQTGRRGGVVRALELLLGRPQRWDAAPTGGVHASNWHARAEIARTASGGMSIARF